MESKDSIQTLSTFEFFDFGEIWITNSSVIGMVSCCSSKTFHVSVIFSCTLFNSCFFFLGTTNDGI